MFNSISLISILEVILLMLPTLLSVAYVTVAERKTMASMQRRLGPNAVGYLKIKWVAEQVSDVVKTSSGRRPLARK